MTWTTTNSTQIFDCHQIVCTHLLNGEGGFIRLNLMQLLAGQASSKRLRRHWQEKAVCCVAQCYYPVQ